MNILSSIANALEYLHQPINTHYGSNHTGVAHRDLKTRNILIKDQFCNCVLADFGFSLSKDDIISPNEPIRAQVGTRRYMAPEVLSNSVATNNLQAFCSTDIYSYALVMWEVLWRAEQEGVYKILFQKNFFGIYCGTFLANNRPTTIGLLWPFFEG